MLYVDYISIKKLNNLKKETKHQYFPALEKTGALWLWWLYHSLNPQWAALKLSAFFCWFPTLLETSRVPPCLNLWPSAATGGSLWVPSLLHSAYGRRTEGQELHHIPISVWFFPVTSPFPCQGDAGLVMFWAVSLLTESPQTGPLISHLSIQPNQWDCGAGFVCIGKNFESQHFRNQR